MSKSCSPKEKLDVGYSLCGIQGKKYFKQSLNRKRFSHLLLRALSEVFESAYISMLYTPETVVGVFRDRDCGIFSRKDEEKMTSISLTNSAFFLVQLRNIKNTSAGIMFPSQLTIIAIVLTSVSSFQKHLQTDPRISHSYLIVF